MNIRKRVATLAALAGLALFGLVVPVHATPSAHVPTAVAAAAGQHAPDSRCC